MQLFGKATAYCFSGTGRTWLLGQLYAQELTSQSVPCHIAPLELGKTEEEPAKDDATQTLLVIGIPLYGRTIAPEIRSWIQALGPGKGQSVALFCTCRTNQGQATRQLAHLLGLCGFDVVHQAIYFGGDRPWSDGQTAWLEADVHEAVTEILAGTRRTVGAAESLDTPTFLVRAGYWFARRRSSRMMAIDSSCNLCMTCLRLCPVGAISIERPADAREGHALSVHISQSCMLCQRCVACCPEHAISLCHSWALAGAQERASPEAGFVQAIEAAYKPLRQRTSHRRLAHMAPLHHTKEIAS